MLRRSFEDLRLRAARANWLTAGIVRLAALSAFIVVIGMLPGRLSPHRAAILIVIAVAVAAAALVLLLIERRRLFARLPLLERGSQRATVAVLLLARHVGLPMLGLLFFLVWTFVYLALWAIHPDEAFRGLDPSPRFADFFYYSVTTAFTSPPEGIAAGSRGVKSATMIELLTALALLSAYLSSFVDWSRRRGED
jgi:hypothetical protein